MIFFFNDTATTEIYTLSLHDALPISMMAPCMPIADPRVLSSDRSATSAAADAFTIASPKPKSADRKSTRLNSSHLVISYAVFCLKKKNRDEPDRLDTD